MKKFFILLAIMFVVSGATGQSNHPCVSCLLEGITFTTQTQIDSFQINYPGCTQILGNVTITGHDITNLNGLNVLTSIGKSLILESNSGLKNFSGLDSLISIGRALYISNDSSLTSLTGLNSLASIGIDFQIQLTYYLTSLTGLNSLTSIGGQLEVYYNYALTSLTGLNSVTSIGEFLNVEGNNVLTSLRGLDSLTSIGQSLHIETNNSLTSLAGLNSLTTVGGELLIRSNPALLNLTGLNILNTIGYYLMIDYNNVLSSLTGIDNIDAESITQIYITENDSLSTCAIKSICNFLATPNGTIIIGNNATGCNSQAEVDTACKHLSVENLTIVDIFSIYPTPSSDYITIETSSKSTPSQLSVLNLHGQQILTHQITEPKTTIDISGLKSGVYFVRLTGEKNVSVGKFVKE